MLTSLRTRTLKTTASLLLITTTALSLSSCGGGSGKNVVIPGVDGPRLSIIENQMLLSLTLTEASIDGGARIPFPKMENSYIEVGPDLKSSGYLIQVGVNFNDLSALLKNEVNTIAPKALPGGRPLPGVVEGQLPAVALVVPKLNNLVFYVGPEIFGFFVPVQFPKEMKGYMATFRFYDTDGSAIGNISVVGPDSANQNGGILVLLPIRGKTANALTAAKTAV